MDLTKYLKKEMLPAMGCTEPAACALAGAKAREILGCDDIDITEVFASRDMVKNAMGVSIPNCELKGIVAAVALGVSGGNTEDKLSILSDVSEAQIEKASKLSAKLNLVSDVPALYVSVKVTAKNGAYSVATVSGEHDRFSHIEKDGKVLVNLPLEVAVEKEDFSEELMKLTIKDIFYYAENVDVADLDFIQSARKSLY